MKYAIASLLTATLVVVALLLALWLRPVMLTYHGELKDVAQTLAIFAGGIAFVYWFVRGALHPGLKLTLNCQHQPASDPKQRFLSALLFLENPGRSSLSLEIIAFRVQKIGELMDTVGTHTVLLRRNDVVNGSVEWNSKSDARPINLASNDATHVGCLFTVANNHAYLVEAIVSAGIPLFHPIRIFRNNMQWRVSCALSVIEEGEPCDEPQSR